MRKQERLMPDGSIKVFTVKRLSDRHSERVAERFRNRGRGYAKQPKRHKSDIVSPLGLPTSSRMPGDERV